MKKVLLVAMLLIFLVLSTGVFSQTRIKKTVFQSFWWDYRNDNYPNSWANYLTELAPRLKAMGFDAVWIPPTSKGGGVGDDGYGIFDHYDLGDKYQKGNVRTRVGTKDELLRMVAVMHANGLEVIQDVVGNQINGAGDTTTNAGIDPAETAWTSVNATSYFDNPYKLFRYSAYATPLKVGTINEYRLKQGRFPKNWENFHPNPNDNCSTGDICQEYFGPDVDYTDLSYGQAGVSPVYDPIQTLYNPYGNAGTVGSSGNGYMRKNMREWLIWYKKQMGFDGVRLDAAKNYDYAASEDFLYNLQHNNGWASGNDSMFAVGEVVGSASDEDSYASSIQNRAGTFDFSMRGYGPNGGIYSMVLELGGYNMQNLPGEQQSTRYTDYNSGAYRVYRTVPFVNSHDTQRPILDALGNFSKPLGDASGWNNGSELGGNGVNGNQGGHIDPREPRLAAAYAAISAIDGNPVYFIEDMFDLGTTGKRYSHLPTNTTDLPVRADLQNIIQASQKLGFKNGDYAVPTALTGGTAPYYQRGNSGDHLIIERIGKAVIGISDFYNVATDNSQDEQTYITTQFPIGTVLYDYSGAHGISSVTVTDNFGDLTNHRLLIQTAPVGHTITGANGHGYSIWAPYPGTPTSVNDLYNYIATYTPQRNTQTTQEWEMADDLGDSHCLSLGYGGQIPSNSTHQRVAGKFFTDANQLITLIVTPAVDGNDITAGLYDLNGNLAAGSNGVITAAAPLTINYTPTAAGWLVVKLHNTNNTSAGQRLFVKASYTAPAVVSTNATVNAVAEKVSIWTGNSLSSYPTDCGNWEEGKIPDASTNVIVPVIASPNFPTFIGTMNANNVTVENGATLNIATGAALNIAGNFTNQNTASQTIGGNIVFNGTTQQTISGLNVFNQIQINNATGVALANNTEIDGQLQLGTGNLILGNNNLTIGAAATIIGPNGNSFIQTTNTAASGGSVCATVGNSSFTFPVGNTNYTPATLINSGTPMSFCVRNFEDVLTNGTSGTSITASGKIKKTWVINPASNGANATITLQWNAANSDGLDNSNCFVSKNEGGTGQTWTSTESAGNANGSDPYTLTTSGITVFSKFSVFSNVTVLPVNFLNITATILGSNAVINWQVANQQNLASYSIEKSTDGNSFTSIGNQLPQNGNGLLSYQFTDNSFTQNAYYRIVSIDLDGTKQYSQQVYLRKGNADNNNFLIAPNPMHNNFKLFSNVASTSPLQAMLLAADGRVLGIENGNLETVSNGLNARMQSQAQGIYLIKITAAGSNQILRLVKQQTNHKLILPQIHRLNTDLLLFPKKVLSQVHGLNTN